MAEVWPWVLSGIGVAGFLLAGRKVWWAWYVNIANQAVWLTYSLITEQYGFLVGVFVYLWVFVGNARRWTRERFPRAEEQTTEDRGDMMKVTETTTHDKAGESGSPARGRWWTCLSSR